MKTFQIVRTFSKIYIYSNVVWELGRIIPNDEKFSNLKGGVALSDQKSILGLPIATYYPCCF